jgi:hypothetical protein
MSSQEGIGKEVNEMARKNLGPLGEEGRKWLKERGAIDDRYKDGTKGVVAKEKRNLEKGMRKLRGQ